MSRKIPIIPFATNGLNSKYLFEQRKYYLNDERIYPVGYNIPRPLDMWYQRPLWGKVDTFQRPVILKKDNLIEVGDVSVLDFVGNAFYDMRKYMFEARHSLKSSSATVIDLNSPIKGYEDPAVAYNFHFKNNLDDPFKNRYLSNQSKNDISSFKQYIKKYISFANRNKEVPHTLTGFLLSPRVSSCCSGLIIEFARDKYDADDQKWVKYLSSDFFTDYIKIAAIHGFYINKHIPWAIAANLNSRNMKRYMFAAGIRNTEENFLNNYLQAEYISFISFKKYMFSSYHSLITSKPKMEKLNFYNCPGSNTLNSNFRTTREIFDRPHEFKSINNITYDEFLNIYPESFFLKYYFKLKLIENDIQLTKEKKDTMLYKLQNIANEKDIFDAILELTNFVAIRINNRYTTYRNKFF